MAKEHKYMFWTDLETTGSDLDDHQIIEIGAAITDLNLNVLAGREYVLPLTREYEVKDVVLEMHAKNGLWTDVRKSKLILEEVDAELAEWIRTFNGSDHMWMAGSGVSHFDRQFYKRDLPLTNKRLTYYAFDVGDRRREYEIIHKGTDWPTDTKNHRAFDDVIFHIEEAKFALDIMRRGMVK